MIVVIHYYQFVFRGPLGRILFIVIGVTLLKKWLLLLCAMLFVHFLAFGRTTTTRKCLILRFCGGRGAQPLPHHHSQGRTRHGLGLEQRPTFLSCLALPIQGQRHVELNHFLFSSNELRYSLLEFNSIQLTKI